MYMANKSIIASSQAIREKGKNMAKRSGGCVTTSRGKGMKSKSKYSDLEKLAFNLGKIQAGLNADTKVKESYDNGLNSKNRDKKKQKPLY